MPRISKASFTCSFVGIIIGIIELINEFVMLDDRPVIFIGVGILNSDK